MGLSISYIWDSEYPWDIRASKFCRSLTAAGHDVHMVARNGRRRPGREAREEATVHRLRPWPALPRRLDDLLMFPAFVNPRWYRRIRDVVTGEATDLIICRDLPLAPLGLVVAKRFGVPCLVDFAENYPAMLRDNGFRSLAARPWNILVRNPKLASLVERWVLGRADHLFVVVEEALQHYVGRGVERDRITVVSNTPERGKPEIFPSEGPSTVHPATEGHRRPFRLVYLGGLEHARGLGTVLRALDILRGSSTAGNRRFHLDVIGRGESEERLHRLARELDLQSTVEFHGWVELRDALTLSARSHVGLVPHEVTEHTSTTVPNKLFDYMALGLPSVASNAPPLRRIIEETGAGRVFEDGDPQSLARVLGELASDPVMWYDMRTRALAASKDRYNWERDQQRLLETVQELARVGRTGADE